MFPQALPQKSAITLRLQRLGIVLSDTPPNTGSMAVPSRAVLQATDQSMRRGDRQRGKYLCAGRNPHGSASRPPGLAKAKRLFIVSRDEPSSQRSSVPRQKPCVKRRNTRVLLSLGAQRGCERCYSVNRK
eukprot:gene12243-biopygen444